MFTRQFFAQNVMRRGGVSQRTPGWFLIENLADATNPSAYSLTITVGDDSEPELREITPKVVYNPKTKQWSANITDIQSSERYITRIKFGPFEVHCVTDLGIPIFPKEVLTEYGAHLQLIPYYGDKTNYRLNSVLHNVDCISCNGEVIGDFGICLYNGTELAPGIDIWGSINTNFDIQVIHSLCKCNGAEITNGISGLADGWFDPSIESTYKVVISVEGQSNKGFGGQIGTYPGSIDLGYPTMGDPRYEYIIGWTSIGKPSTSGTGTVLTIHPYWLDSSVLDYYTGIVRQLNK